MEVSLHLLVFVPAPREMPPRGVELGRIKSLDVHLPAFRLPLGARGAGAVPGIWGAPERRERGDDMKRQDQPVQIGVDRWLTPNAVQDPL